MTDFEVAMRNAIRYVYPGIQIHTCWFHLCQAAKRKAHQLPHFVNSIKTNPHIKEIYYKLLSLPLLPRQDITEQFYTLKQSALEIDKNASRQFLKYFEEHWIKKVVIFL